MNRSHYYGLIPIAIAALSLLTGCREQNAGDGAVSQARAVEISNIYLEARHTHNLELLDKIYSPGVIAHDVGQGLEFRGLDSLKILCTASQIAFPDLHFTFDEMRISGDWIIWLWTLSGTNTGPLKGMPPTGKPFSLKGVAIDRVENSLIVEEWVYWNLLDLLSALGFSLVPPEVPMQ